MNRFNKFKRFKIFVISFLLLELQKRCSIIFYKNFIIINNNIISINKSFIISNPFNIKVYVYKDTESVFVKEPSNVRMKASALGIYHLFNDNKCIFSMDYFEYHIQYDNKIRIIYPYYYPRIEYYVKLDKISIYRITDNSKYNQISIYDRNMNIVDIIPFCKFYYVYHNYLFAIDIDNNYYIIQDYLLYMGHYIKSSANSCYAHFTCTKGSFFFDAKNDRFLKINLIDS